LQQHVTKHDDNDLMKHNINMYFDGSLSPEENLARHKWARINHRVSTSDINRASVCDTFNNIKRHFGQLGFFEYCTLPRFKLAVASAGYVVAQATPPQPKKTITTRNNHSRSHHQNRRHHFRK
jgi:hypothetical protein